MAAHERRHTIGMRDGWDCRYCGKPTECFTCAGRPMTRDEEIRGALAGLPLWATVDHVIAKSLGGTDALWNLVIACYACNQIKANREVLPGDSFGQFNGLRHRDARKMPPRRRGSACGTSGRDKMRKRFASVDEAIKMVVAVGVSYGVRMTQYQCLLCGYWHIAHESGNGFELSINMDNELSKYESVR